MLHTVYLALGANLGDRLAVLYAAAAALPPAVLVTARSPVYETPPWGFTDQPAFLNQALSASTALPPLALLAYLKQIETRLGRQPTFRNGPRAIDLDILCYDDLNLSTPMLTLPHPRLPERAFVLKPLSAIAPDLRHPVLGQTISELCAQVDATGIVIFGGDDAEKKLSAGMTPPNLIESR